MFTKLLVPLDRSDLGEQALGPAMAIARAARADIDLTLVHQPLPFSGFGDAPWNAGQLNDEETYLRSIASEVERGTGATVTHAVLRGDVVEGICSRAHDVHADLMVMTSHGRTGLSRAWMGSVANGVLRRAGIPVLMLHPTDGAPARTPTEQPFKKVLVPLDGSALSQEILGAAADLARCGSARVVLLRVVQPVPLITTDAGMSFIYPPTAIDEVATKRLADEARRALAEAAHLLVAKGVTEAEAQVVVNAKVAQAILDFVAEHEVDVIAMSTHGRGASRFFLGSVADKVVRAGAVPVLVSRPATIAMEPALMNDASIAQQLPALTSV